MWVRAKEDSSFVTMIDPEITFQVGDRTSDEGCLSIPNESATVVRSHTVTVQYRDLDGEQQTLTTEGLLSSAIQHEIDHLDGIVFIQHLGKVTQSMVRRRMLKLKKQIIRGQVRMSPGYGGFRL
jgi:peptide deformylase